MFQTILTTLIILILVIYYKYRDVFFWLLLNLYLDPAGVITHNFGIDFLGPIKYYDVIFLFIIIAFYRIYKHNIFNRIDIQYRRFLYYLLFLLIYYYIVNLWLVPAYFGRENLVIDNFIDGRRMVYAFCIGIMVYYSFLIYGGNKLFKVTLIVSIVSFVIYFISLFFDLPLIPIITMDRYGDESLIRTGMISYGLFYWITYFGWIFIFFRNRFFKNQTKTYRWTIIVFVIFIIVILMTFTRRQYFELVLTPIIIYLIVKKITPIKLYLSKMTAIFTMVILMLLIFAPSLLQGSSQIMKDTFLLIFTGEDTRGESNYRVDGTGDLLLTKAYIAEHPYFGNGYFYFNYDDKDEKTLGDMTLFAVASDAAREVPIYNVFFERGIVGFLLYIPYYYVVLKLLFLLLKLIKSKFYYFVWKDKYSVLFVLMISVVYAQQFSIKLYTLFGTYLDIIPMIYIGILFAANRRLKLLND